MSYFRESSPLHIDELSTSCLQCFSSFPRGHELIPCDECTTFEFWMFYCDEIEERIET
jgi:hypothetical protein